MCKRKGRGRGRGREKNRLSIIITHLSRLVLAISMSLAVSGEMFHCSCCAGLRMAGSTGDTSDKISYFRLCEKTKRAKPLPLSLFHTHTCMQAYMHTHTHTHLWRMSILKILVAMAAGPSPAECSRVEPLPPSSPTTICGGSHYIIQCYCCPCTSRNPGPVLTPPTCQLSYLHCSVEPPVAAVLLRPIPMQAFLGHHSSMGITE